MKDGFLMLNLECPLLILISTSRISKTHLWYDNRGISRDD